MYAIPADSFKSLADWRSLGIGGFPPRLATLPRKAAMYMLYDLTQLNDDQIALLDRARDFLLEKDEILLNTWCGSDCRYNGQEKQNEQLLFEVFSHFGCEMRQSTGLTYWTRGSSAIVKHSFRDWRDVQIAKHKESLQKEVQAKQLEERRWVATYKMGWFQVVIAVLSLLAGIIIGATAK